MNTFVLLALVAPVVLFVIWPLFSAETEGSAVVESRSAALQRRKIDAYGAIKEAEFDRQMGKLSERDFENVVGRFRAQAIEAITELEENGIASPAGETAKNTRPNFCAACGEKVRSGNFCASCGASLQA
jgi:hypothetical protein